MTVGGGQEVVGEGGLAADVDAIGCQRGPGPAGQSGGIKNQMRTDPSAAQLHRAHGSAGAEVLQGGGPTNRQMRGI
jgi:hypothetical protein